MDDAIKKEVINRLARLTYVTRIRVRGRRVDKPEPIAREVGWLGVGREGEERKDCDNGESHRVS